MLGHPLTPTLHARINVRMRVTYKVVMVGGVLLEIEVGLVLNKHLWERRQGVSQWRPDGLENFHLQPINSIHTTFMVMVCYSFMYMHTQYIQCSMQTHGMSFYLCTNHVYKQKETLLYTCK